MIKKEEVLSIIKELELENAVRNLQIMGGKVMLDIVSVSPAMHEKKKLQEGVEKALLEKLPEGTQVKVNIIVEAPKKVEIKGTKIEGVQNIIAVSSGKGGVGKSTVSANLAVTLANMGFKVGLLDADIYGPSMPIMFDVMEQQPEMIQVDGKNKMLPVESYGVKLLSIGFFINREQAVVWRGAMATKALVQMIRDAQWGELDFLILDLPPGTGDIHLSIVQEVPVTGAVIVSTPQHIALEDVKKGVSMFKMDEINVPVLGVVENMAYFTPEELPDNKYFIFGKHGAKKMAKALNVPFLGEIPLVQSVREGGDIGKPVALWENSHMKEVYENITRELIASLLERNENIPETEAVRITTMLGCSPK